MGGSVTILGLGFTTQRLARRLLARGVPVYAAVRDAARFREWEALGLRLCGLTANDLPRSAVLVHSIPPLAEPERSALRELILEAAPRRILYISSTVVYGPHAFVSESTPAAPVDDKGRARTDEEQWIASMSGCSSLILRSAAIYGPGRGIHVRLREGKLPRGSGSVVSRIHVDDLASLLDAAIESQIEGAWPVADDLPASAEEIASWCSNLMGLPLPVDSTAGFPVTGRRVDGSKIRELLGVELRYPSYLTGIPACLREEERRPSLS